VFKCNNAVPVGGMIGLKLYTSAEGNSDGWDNASGAGTLYPYTCMLGYKGTTQ